MGCPQSKTQSITTLPKGATPEKAPTDYRRKNQYHIPVVLPPSRDNSEPVPKTNDDTIEAIIRSQNESNGNAVIEEKNGDIQVNGKESVGINNNQEEKEVVIEAPVKTTRSVAIEQEDDFKWNDIVDAPVTNNNETVEDPVESPQDEVVVEVARKSVESVIEEAEDKLNKQLEETAETVVIEAHVEPTKAEPISVFITSESIVEDEGNKTIESAQNEESLQSNDEEHQKNEEAALQDTTETNKDEVLVGTTVSVEDVIESKEERIIEEPTIEEPTIEEPSSTTEKITEERIPVRQETQESNEIVVDNVEAVKEDTEIDVKQIEEPTTQEVVIEEKSDVSESNEATVENVKPMMVQTEELKEEIPHEEVNKKEENLNKELVDGLVTNEEIVEKHDDVIPEPTKEDNQQTEAVEPKEAISGEVNQGHPEETTEVASKEDEKIAEIKTVDKLEESRKSIDTTEAPVITTEEPNQKNTDDVSQENVMSKTESTINVTENLKETESKLQAENNENTVGV